MELRHLDVLLYPPALTIILLLIAAIFRHRKTLAASLFSLAIIIQLVLSLPVVADRLYASVHEYPAIPAAELPTLKAEAIVLLGAGLWHNSIEYGEPTLHQNGLERTRYAAFVARKTGLPILVSGGDAMDYGYAEADVTQAVLKDEYQLENIWIENKSKNTFENAHNTVEILKQKGIERVYLVTSSYHMKRAMQTFSEYPLEIIPAPIGVYQAGKIRLRDFIPRSGSMDVSNRVLHEYLGRLWYWLKS